MRSGVTIRASGLMLEKLISRAVEAGASFSRVVRIDERTVELDAGRRSAEAFLSLAARYSIPAQVVSRRGASRALHEVRRRWTMGLGVMLAAGVMVFFLARVWRIDVVPASGALPDGGASIRETLTNLGVSPGMTRSKIDESALSLAIAAENPGYAFVTVKVSGVRLCVTARAEGEEIPVYDISQAGDLIASRDGIVESITVLAGRGMVRPGDLVRKGDVLIAGEERISDEESRPIAALGSVMARVWYEGVASAPAEYPARVYTGRESVGKRLRLFDFCMDISPGEEYYLSEESVSRLPVVGLFLPVMVEQITSREYRIEPRETDPAGLERALSILAQLDAARGLEGGEMRDGWATVRRENGMIIVRAVAEALEEIARPRGELFGG